MPAAEGLGGLLELLTPGIRLERRKTAETSLHFIAGAPLDVWQWGR